MPLPRLSLPEIFSVTCAPVSRFCLCLLIACAFNGAAAFAQVSSEENPQNVAKASPSPAKSPTPKPKASPKKKKATAKKTPSPSKKKKKAKASPSPSPKKKTKASATPSPKKSPSPTPVPQAAEELGPRPTPTPRRGWWFWSRPEVNYHYLSRSVRSEIDRAPVMRRRWQFIVVHNSGTRQGSARIFDYYHRHVRRMQNGLAYHFVIGNGTSTGNGQVEVGDRWRRQINGGHVHSDYLNNIALGICLVGDFNRDQPTRRQLEACEELINYLRKRCGKIDGHYAVVRPHREVNPPQWATDCPGDAFPYSWS